jgi:isopentenyl-diphosphate Delta-isomerase
MSKEKLNIVDDNDNIIGIEDRNTIHEKGLLHREVHVYFITSGNEILFQHRANNKETFPGILDATVGGHVEIGDSYEETATKETFEETGVTIKAVDLIPVDKIHKNSKDEVTGKINHAFQQVFIYRFPGKIGDLKIEEGEGVGFESWTIEKILAANDADKLKFIPYIYKFSSTTLIDYIKNKLQ